MDKKFGGSYYVMLLNIYLYCPSKELFRHSIGIQKTVNVNNSNDRFYVIFDPSYGVYVVDNPAEFLDGHFLKQYAEQRGRIGQRLVYFQYQAIRREGNFYRLCR